MLSENHNTLRKDLAQGLDTVGLQFTALAVKHMFLWRSNVYYVGHKTGGNNLLNSLSLA